MSRARIRSYLIIWKWWFLYGFLIWISAVVSYALTDPNLVLSQNAQYWSFQQWMWKSLFDYPPRIALGYVVLMIALWSIYSAVVSGRDEWSRHLTKTRIIALCLLVITPLAFSYNALSHDVFNYMFNAKMVLTYHQNPHMQVALNFPDDTWTRFMHNTHTAAPYGYGWTALSLLPALLGMQKFLVTWWLFRIMSVVSLALTALVLWKWAKIERIPQGKSAVLLVLLSPFVLIEAIMNMHNDLWMMAAAVSSVFCLYQWMKGNSWKWFIGAMGLWLFSVSLKLASVVLLPLFVVMIVGRSLPRVGSRLTTSTIALLASGLFFLLLLTPQSKWFLPWYLMWVVVWMPLMHKSVWYFWLVGLMVSSTFRYLPWLYSGGYEQGLTGALLITWLGGALIAIILVAWNYRASNKISV